MSNHQILRGSREGLGSRSGWYCSQTLNAVFANAIGLQWATSGIQGPAPCSFPMRVAQKAGVELPEPDATVAHGPIQQFCLPLDALRNHRRRRATCTIYFQQCKFVALSTDSTGILFLRSCVQNRVVLKYGVRKLHKYCTAFMEKLFPWFDGPMILCLCARTSDYVKCIPSHNATKRRSFQQVCFRATEHSCV